MNKITEKLLKLLPYIKNARLRISLNKVPHLVVAEKYSIAWMKRKKIFRVFYPYPSHGKEQTRIDFTSESLLISYFNGIN